MQMMDEKRVLASLPASCNGARVAVRRHGGCTNRGGVAVLNTRPTPVCRTGRAERSPPHDMCPTWQSSHLGRTERATSTHMRGGATSRAPALTSTVPHLDASV
jgi:hypothetical protein